ncbi:MAG: Gfo/Idh/MocA family oxidoreductase [Planctomycetota bacterium]
MNAPRLGVGLIGSKFMGRTHSNAYLKADKFFDLPLAPSMEAIAARDAADLAQFAPRWGWKSHTTRWQDLCENPDIALVDVGTPNHVHREQSIAALEAGKHVACEKPLAGTLDDAREMLQAAQRAEGLQTFVWYNYRRCPAVALAHQLVSDGKIGRIFHVRAQYLQDWGGPETPLLWRFRGQEAGSGAHGDLNAHIIDMVRFVTGQEITEVVGAIEETFIKQRQTVESLGGDPQYGPSTVDDAVAFLARLSGGAAASFEASRLATGNKNANGFEINGEHGSLRFDFERMNELEYFDNTAPKRVQGWTTINVTRGEDGHPYAGNWWPAAHIIGYEHGFINQVADMCFALAGQKPPVPLPDFADAYETQKVLHAAVESARNRCPVALSEIS